VFSQLSDSRSDYWWTLFIFCTSFPCTSAAAGSCTHVSV